MNTPARLITQLGFIKSGKYVNSYTNRHKICENKKPSMDSKGFLFSCIPLYLLLVSLPLEHKLSILIEQFPVDQDL